MRRFVLTAFAAFLLIPAAGSSAAPRIVGGGDAKAGDLPYVANIAIAGSFGCTGSLIAPQWVMTAGHCGTPSGEAIGSPVPFPPSSYTVTLDTVQSDGTGGEAHRVTEVRIDPDYTGSNGNDVSLLKLDTPSKVTPVRIAARGERALWATGQKETIAGFGTTTENGDAPKTMQVAHVPIVSDADCAKAYAGGGLPVASTPGFQPDSMVCAGYPNGGTDTCQGDSGGPLLASIGAGAYRLVGATSYGEGCAQPGFPGVYARIADVRIRKFVEGVVPAAYAAEPTGTATPSPTATPAACAHRARVTFGRQRRVRVTFAGKTIYAARGARIRTFRYRLPAGGTADLRVTVVSRHGRRRVLVRHYVGCRLKSVKRA